MTRKTFHMGVCIEGVLRRSDSDLRNLFKEADGTKRTGKYVRDWLKLQLSNGKKMLPIGKKCEGWSDLTGCPGHPIEEDQP